MKNANESVTRLERPRHVAILRINRPDVRNALSLPLLEALVEALQACDADSEVRAVVLTGGDTVFSSGADIEMLSGQTAATYPGSRNARAFAAIRRIEKPVVAAVSGVCLGGGCEIALSCDLIVASDTARFGQPEVRLGIIPGAGGTQLWAERAGSGFQARCALDGDMVDAFQARRAGLVEQVVPVIALERAALDLAQRIAARAPMAVRAAKTAMRAHRTMPLASALTHEVSLMAGLLSTQDAREGIAAFIEKRSPSFEGR